MTSDYIQVFILSLVKIPKRLQGVAVNYLMMLDTARHSMSQAVKLSNLSVLQFSRFLVNHKDLAISGLQDLAITAPGLLEKGSNHYAPNHLGK